jgi:hypothetical protein
MGAAGTAGEVGCNPEPPGDLQAEIDRLVRTYQSLNTGSFGRETPISGNQSDSAWAREASRSYTPARPIGLH